jgi:hypothetical protein
MFKMGLDDPFEYLQHKLWLKKKPKVKMSIWLPTIKSWELPWITCVQVACHIFLESSILGIQLFLKPHLNQRFSQDVMAFQSDESPNFENCGTLELGVLKKMTFGCSPIANHRKYYKREGCDFPQVWAMMSLMNPCMPMVHLCTTSDPIMHKSTCCLVCASPYE